MAIGPGRCVHAQEHDLGLVHGELIVAREREATRFERGPEAVLEALLVERHGSVPQGVQFALVDLDPDDASAEVREARGDDRADVSTADHGDARIVLWFRHFSLPSPTPLVGAVGSSLDLSTTLSKPLNTKRGILRQGVVSS